MRCANVSQVIWEEKTNNRTEPYVREMEGVKRYHILDGIRGLVLTNMILFHAIWDMVYIYHHNIGWFGTDLAHIWQQWICCTFILLSGFCWNLGKRQIKRGMTVSACGLIVTAVTLIIMPEDRIIFGILILLGSCMVFLCPLDKIFKKVKPQAGVILSAALFAIFRNINAGYIGFGQWKLIELPNGLYANLFTAYLGFPPGGFHSTDYFSVFPWLFLFCAGYFLYRLVKERGWMKYLANRKCRILEWLGEHSLEIYMMHQPVIMLVLYLFH